MLNAGPYSFGHILTGNHISFIIAYPLAFIYGFTLYKKNPTLQVLITANVTATSQSNK